LVPSCSLIVLSVFFFYCYGDPRDLHSFPTRRSSDLNRDISIVISGNMPAPDEFPSYPDYIHFDYQHLVDLKNDAIWAKVALISLDRKSTRLNSSHVKISYAVFCLKKKKLVLYTPHSS